MSEIWDNVKPKKVAIFLKSYDREEVVVDLIGLLQLNEPNLLACVLLHMDNAATQPLLILALGERLIHGPESRLLRDADFMMGPFHDYRRPHVNEFLAETSSHYDMAVWSSASWDYVVRIGDELSSLVPKCQFVWSRFRCAHRMHPELMQAYFVNDVKQVKRRGFNPNRVLIVDDTRLDASRNYDNATYILLFEGADDDNALTQLVRYINALRFESDSLIDSIKAIVEFGGDTDTIASMFGHVFGAANGTACLPMEIVEQIDDYDLITRTTAELNRVAGAR